MAFVERVRGDNFVIFAGNETKENSENAGPVHGKGSHLTARAPLQDRTSSMQNATRVQPCRPGKQQTSDVENCGGKVFSQATISATQVAKSELRLESFTIFQDHSQPVTSNHVDTAVDVKSRIDEHEDMELHPSVTAVFRPETVDGAVVESLNLNDSMKDSLMSLCTPDEEMQEDDSTDIAEEICLQRKELNDNHLWFPEYRHEIYQYLRGAELRLGIRPDYMRKQTEITYNMRSILVDWMVEVAEEYKLERETLCLSISFVDRFLSLMAVARNKLQLVGTAAMFIAAKYEEIYPPDVGEFVYITDNSYTKKQVLQMERLILRTLSFNIASPTVNCFCSNLLTNLVANEKTSSLAMYLLELSMLDGEKFLKYTPSVIATSCVCLAHYIEGQSGFMAKVSDLTGYRFEDLSSCASDLFNVFSISATLQYPAIREKYSKTKWHRVSEICPTTSQATKFPESFS